MRRCIAVYTFDDFVGWATHQTVFFVACNSDSETLAALQTAKTVLCTQRHRLDADKFPMFSVGCSWHEFCRDSDPYWFKVRRARRSTTTSIPLLYNATLKRELR